MNISCDNNVMEFFHGIVAVLAGVVLILSGLVIWVYLQQSRQAHAINALAIALTTPPPSFPSPEEVVPTQEEEVHDDRVSVKEDEDEEVAEDDGGEPDVSDLKSKTVVQLREMLTEKGIPFNKCDKKTTLISLVQAAS